MDTSSIVQPPLAAEESAPAAAEESAPLAAEESEPAAAEESAPLAADESAPAAAEESEPAAAEESAPYPIGTYRSFSMVASDPAIRGRLGPRVLERLVHMFSDDVGLRSSMRERVDESVQLPSSGFELQPPSSLLPALKKICADDVGFIGSGIALMEGVDAPKTFWGMLVSIARANMPVVTRDVMRVDKKKPGSAIHLLLSCSDEDLFVPLCDPHLVPIRRLAVLAFKDVVTELIWKLESYMFKQGSIPNEADFLTWDHIERMIRIAAFPYIDIIGSSSDVSDYSLDMQCDPIDMHQTSYVSSVESVYVRPSSGALCAFVKKRERASFNVSLYNEIKTLFDSKISVLQSRVHNREYDSHRVHAEESSDGRDFDVCKDLMLEIAFMTLNERTYALQQIEDPIERTCRIAERVDLILSSPLCVRFGFPDHVIRLIMRTAKSLVVRILGLGRACRGDWMGAMYAKYAATYMVRLQEISGIRPSDRCESVKRQRILDQFQMFTHKRAAEFERPSMQDTFPVFDTARSSFRVGILSDKKLACTSSDVIGICVETVSGMADPSLSPP
jgi:hypothetical protein